MKAPWIKLSKAITKSPIFDNPDVLKVWIWLLCKACFKETETIVGNTKVNVLPGQVVLSRKNAAEELKLTESKFYRIITLLKNLKCITINSNNKFSVINIEKWAFYQVDNLQSEQQMNSKRTANEQQMNTYKNIKNNKNIKNIYNNNVPTPKATKFSNFTQTSNVDYKKLEMDALRKRIERNRESV